MALFYRLRAVFEMLLVSYESLSWTFFLPPKNFETPYKEIFNKALSAASDQSAAKDEIHGVGLEAHLVKTPAILAEQCRILKANYGPYGLVRQNWIIFYNPAALNNYRLTPVGSCS